MGGAEYALYQKGVVQGLMGRNQDKIATLNSLIEQYSRSIYVDQAIYEKGETYTEMNNSNAAITAYTESHQDSRPVLSLLNLS